MEKIFLTVEDKYINERADKWLSECLDDVTRSFVQKLCDDNMILIAGKPIGKNYRLRKADIVEVTMPEPEELNIIAQNIPLDIVYEDEDLIVVNKAKGMVVHPAVGNLDGTLVNALLYHCQGKLSGINGVIRPGIVHRIDKDTSGLLIVAKNDMAHQSLAKQISEHSFDRFYHAVVNGKIKDDRGTINQPIGRHPADRKKMAVTEQSSRDAVTHFEVLERYSGYTYLKLKLETGRTHQIRVHMAYIGFPILGDIVYGLKKGFKGLEGQCLHAQSISFVHPRTGELMNFSSELPQYFQDVLKKINI